MKRGISLIAVLMFMLAATTASIVVFKLIGSENFSSAARLKQSEAYQASESGINVLQSWLINKGADAGALITQYITANDKKPIKINFGSYGNRDQNFEAYMMGVDMSGRQMKLKFLVKGIARDNSQVTQTAIMSIDGLYQVIIPPEIEIAPTPPPGRKNKLPGYFGGSLTFSGGHHFSSAFINGSWTGNPQTVDSDFVVTKNFRNSGNSVDIGGNLCVGGNYDPDNDKVTVKGNTYIGSSIGGNGNFLGTYKGHVYCQGAMEMKHTGGGAKILGSLTIGGPLTFTGGASYSIGGSLALRNPALVNGSGIGSSYNFSVCDSVWSDNSGGVTGTASTDNGKKIRFNTCASSGFFAFPGATQNTGSGSADANWKTNTDNYFWRGTTNANTTPSEDNRPKKAEAAKAHCDSIWGAPVQSGTGCDGSNYVIGDPIASSLGQIKTFLSSVSSANANETVTVTVSGQTITMNCLSNTEIKITNGGQTGNSNREYDYKYVFPAINACWDRMKSKTALLYNGYLVMKLNQVNDHSDKTALKGKFVFIYNIPNSQGEKNVQIQPTEDNASVMMFLENGIPDYGELKLPSGGCVPKPGSGNGNYKYNYFIYSLGDIYRVNIGSLCPLNGNFFFPQAGCKKIKNITGSFTVEENGKLVDELMDAGILCMRDGGSGDCTPAEIASTQGRSSNSSASSSSGSGSSSNSSLTDPNWIPIASRISVKLENKEISKEKISIFNQLNPSVISMPRVMRTRPDKNLASLAGSYVPIFLNGAPISDMQNLSCVSLKDNSTASTFSAGRYKCSYKAGTYDPYFYVIASELTEDASDNATCHLRAKNGVPGKTLNISQGENVYAPRILCPNGSEPNYDNAEFQDIGGNGLIGIDNWKTKSAAYYSRNAGSSSNIFLNNAVAICGSGMNPQIPCGTITVTPPKCLASGSYAKSCIAETQNCSARVPAPYVSCGSGTVENALFNFSGENDASISTNYPSNNWWPNSTHSVVTPGNNRVVRMYKISCDGHELIYSDKSAKGGVICGNVAITLPDGTIPGNPGGNTTQEVSVGGCEYDPEWCHNMAASFPTSLPSSGAQSTTSRCIFLKTITGFNIGSNNSTNERPKVNGYECNNFSDCYGISAGTKDGGYYVYIPANGWISTLTGTTGTADCASVSCDYEESFCDGKSFADVDHNKTTSPTVGQCLFISEFTHIRPANNNNNGSTILINGVTCDKVSTDCKHPSSKDGGYYIYLKSGYFSSQDGWAVTQGTKSSACLAATGSGIQCVLANNGQETYELGGGTYCSTQQRNGASVPIPEVTCDGGGSASSRSFDIDGDLTTAGTAVWANNAATQQFCYTTTGTGRPIYLNQLTCNGTTYNTRVSCGNIKIVEPSVAPLTCTLAKTEVTLGENIIAPTLSCSSGTPTGKNFSNSAGTMNDIGQWNSGNQTYYISKPSGGTTDITVSATCNGSSIPNIFCGTITINNPTCNGLPTEIAKGATISPAPNVQCGNAGAATGIDANSYSSTSTNCSWNGSGTSGYFTRTNNVTGNCQLTLKKFTCNGNTFWNQNFPCYTGSSGTSQNVSVTVSNTLTCTGLPETATPNSTIAAPTVECDGDAVQSITWSNPTPNWYYLAAGIYNVKATATCGTSKTVDCGTLTVSPTATCSNSASSGIAFSNSSSSQCYSLTCSSGQNLDIKNNSNTANSYKTIKVSGGGCSVNNVKIPSNSTVSNVCTSSNGTAYQITVDETFAGGMVATCVSGGSVTIASGNWSGGTNPSGGTDLAVGANTITCTTPAANLKCWFPSASNVTSNGSSATASTCNAPTTHKCVDFGACSNTTTLTVTGSNVKCQNAF